VKAAEAAEEPEPEPQQPEAAAVVPTLPEESRPTAPPPPPSTAPPPQSRPPECVPYHYWEVAYDRGELGADGVWRFPHRCRNCGLEVLATDVDDATAQADRL
jgi:hypothetical protein